MKLKLLICSLISLAIGGFVFAPKAQAFDESYLQGRAIQLANFSEDEIVVKPKLVYNFASKQFKSAALSSPNTRVVKLIDPKFSISGISAVFVAPKYRIIDQSTTYELFSFKRRVGDILADGGVELAKEDKVNPPAESLAPSEENLIKITRVSIAQIEEFEPVPYPQKKIDDPDLNQGTQKVTKAGKIGKKKPPIAREIKLQINSFNFIFW